MKKNTPATRKLGFTKQTLRVLSAQDMKRIAGGTATNQPTGSCLTNCCS